MMKSNREKRGQFVIIAIMLIAIMIVSIGALMHGAITYYRHEPWEEYSTLIGNIELNSQRLLELSLADFTNSGQDKLSYNLKSWENDLRKIYPSSGIFLSHEPTNVAPAPIWDTRTAVSEAQVDFKLNITAIGLTGYKFTTKAAVKLTIINATSTSPYQIFAAVKNEDDVPIGGLNINSFKVNGASPTAVGPVLDGLHSLIYQIQYDGAMLPATVEVWDQRGIYVRGSV
jgi:hypothetical protein